jgi:hypothetical protein
MIGKLAESIASCKVSFRPITSSTSRPKVSCSAELPPAHNRAGVLDANRQLAQCPSVSLHAAEVLIKPQHNIPLARSLSQSRKSAQRVRQGLATGQNPMQENTSAGGLQKRHRVVFQHVVPQRYERRSVVVHDEGTRLREQALHEAVERPLVNRSLPHQVQPLSPEFVVLRRRLIHRVGVNLPGGNSFPVSEVLGQQRGNEAFADTSLPCRREMHRSAREIPCGICTAIPSVRHIRSFVAPFRGGVDHLGPKSSSSGRVPEYSNPGRCSLNRRRFRSGSTGAGLTDVSPGLSGAVEYSACFGTRPAFG